MKKAITLLLAVILCFTSYLLVQRTNSIGKYISQTEAPRLKSETSMLNLGLKEPIQQSKQITPEKQPEESQRYILDCSHELESMLKANENSLFLDQNSTRQSLKESQNNAAKIAYALSYANESSASDKSIKDQNSISLILALLDEQPSNKMLNYFLVSKCSEEKNHQQCSKTLLSNASDIDFNNGALWFQLAVIEASQKNIPGVISALEQVTVSSEFNSYWAESIELFDQALESIGFKNTQSRMIAAIGHAAAMSIGPVQNLFNICKENSQARADLAQACLEAGKRLANGGKIMINQSLGFSLQKSVYQILGDKERVAEIVKLMGDNSKVPEESNQANQLALFDSELNQYWFEQLKLFGEKKSFQLLTEEAIRLSSNPSYNPCSDWRN